MYQRPDGRWQAIKTVNGIRTSFYSCEKTKRAAEKDIAAQIEEREKQGKQETRFGHIAEEWLAYKKETVGEKTYETYIPVVRRFQELKGKAIETITPQDIQHIINDLYRQGFSKTVLLRTKNVFSMISDFALGKGIMVANITRAITIPKNAKRDARDALSQEEIDIVIDHANGEFGLYPLFLLYTGCRRGEALALQWQDIDFENDTITIKKAIEYAQNQGKIKLPKTASGVREIPLLEVLKEKLPRDKPAEDYIFGEKRPYSETMIKKRWNKYLKETQLNITQHQLRHTYATMLVKAGINVKTAQQLLGHSDVQTTLNIYTHIGNSLNEDAKSGLNQYVNKYTSKNTSKIKKSQ